MSKYEIYIDKINSARSIEELKQITNEIENNFSGIEKSSLINKIESKKSEVNTNSNEVKSDVTSKSNDTISINKSTLKKAGIIGLFAGVAILSSVVTTKLNKGNDYNAANNIPTQTVADVPTYTDSQYEPTMADNETTTPTTSIDTASETSENATKAADEYSLVDSPVLDEYLNIYSLSNDQLNEYNSLSDEDKATFRYMYTVDDTNILVDAFVKDSYIYTDSSYPNAMKLTDYASNYRNTYGLSYNSNLGVLTGGIIAVADTDVKQIDVYTMDNIPIAIDSRDQFLNNYNLNQDIVDEYNNLTNNYKEFYRLCYDVDDSIISDAIMSVGLKTCTFEEYADSYDLSSIAANYPQQYERYLIRTENSFTK